MNVPARIASAWRSAQLLVAFHRNPDGRARAEPWLWSPKNGVAGVTSDPRAKEAILVVNGDGDAGDVQIKLHSDKIILRRDPEAAGWSGLSVDHHGVSVLVGDVWVTVNGDGSITRKMRGNDEDTSWLEADGSYIRISEDMHVEVAGDGSKMTRRTNDRLDVVTPAGIMSSPTTKSLNGK